jgi:apolipoprotein N-acyltransferase
MAMTPTGEDLLRAKEGLDSGSHGTRAEPLPMTEVRPTSSTAVLSLKAAISWALVAIVAFHLAYASPRLSWLIAGYLIGLIQLAKARSGRVAFYFGVGVGFVTAASQMSCFWVIFGPSAIALWLVLGFWIGLFVAIARLCLSRFGSLRGALLIPFLWTGLEYFRSELYYLRFSWLNIGYAFSGTLLLPALKWIGMYGIGFLLAGVATLICLLAHKRLSLSTPALAVVLASALLSQFGPTPDNSSSSSAKSVRVAGVQMEFVSEAEILAALDKLLLAAPDAELLMLSEYALDGPVPDKIKSWCREHRRYLVFGGKDAAPTANFYDTAFVVDPTGEIVFRQGKSVPIQFFKDGLPAREQKLWDSPWGKIGICICYDLSYTRVTDRLIRLGAQGLIVPTMDVVDWGRRQHELHAMVAPVRAAEYGVPVLRVASSGISQLVGRRGQVSATAGFPGQNETLSGQLMFANAGSLPPDRALVVFATVLTGLVIVWIVITSMLAKAKRDGRTSPASQSASSPTPL